MECTTSLKSEPGCRRSGDATHESLATIVIGCWSTAAVFVLTAAFLVGRRLFVGVAPASDAVLATSALVVPAAVNASRLLNAWAARLLASAGRLSPELARRSWLATAATLSAAALLWGLALSFPQPNAWPLVLWWSTLAAGEAWWWTWSACLRRSTADMMNSDVGKHASGQGGACKSDVSPARLEPSCAEPARAVQNESNTVAAGDRKQLDANEERGGGPEERVLERKPARDEERDEVHGEEHGGREDEGAENGEKFGEEVGEEVGEEEVDAETGPLLAAGVDQQTSAGVDSHGHPKFEGVYRVRFAAGQRAADLHVPLCPPWPQAPQVVPTALAGPALTIHPAQVQPFGVRLELKRTSTSEPAEAIVHVALVTT